MTATIKDRKYELIEKITALQNESDIAEIEADLKLLDLKTRFSEVFKPKIADIMVGQLRKAQQYDQLPGEKIQAIIDQMDIQEDLETLLAQLP